MKIGDVAGLRQALVRIADDADGLGTVIVDGATIDMVATGTRTSKLGEEASVAATALARLRPDVATHADTVMQRAVFHVGEGARMKRFTTPALGEKWSGTFDALRDAARGAVAALDAEPGQATFEGITHASLADRFDSIARRAADWDLTLVAKQPVDWKLQRSRMVELYRDLSAAALDLQRVEPHAAGSVEALRKDAVHLARQKGHIASAADTEPSLHENWVGLFKSAHADATAAAKLVRSAEGRRAAVAGAEIAAGVDKAAVDAIRAVPVGDNLTKYATDLTEAAIAGKVRGAIGREQELDRIIEILGQPQKNNPLVLGVPGAGKTALAEELAIRIARGDVPDHLRGRRIMAIDVNAMEAGTQYRGMFEERLKGIVDEVVASDGMIIPFVDEVHTLVSAGSAQNIDGASQALKPALARGELRMLSATTIDEAEQVYADPAFARRFTELTIDPTSPDDTLRILREAAPKMEDGHAVRFTDAALKASVDYSSRYLYGRHQPDAALTLASEAIGKLSAEGRRAPDSIVALREEVGSLRAELRIVGREQSPESVARAQQLQGEVDELARSLEADEQQWRLARSAAAGETLPEGTDVAALREQFPAVFATEVGEDDVARAISRMADVPLGSVTMDEVERMRALPSALKDRVLGQETAADELASAIVRARTGVADPSRPVASVFELGPPGVGKTEMAKALANHLFGTDDALIRIDMGTHRVAGTNPLDAIRDGLRRRPHAVVLVDEVEKGNPGFYDGLMTALGEGYISGDRGNVSTRDAVFILTSNLEEQQLGEFFRPEFLDRIDAIVKFERPLAEHVDTLVGRELDAVGDRLQARYGAQLVISDETRQHLREQALGDGRAGVRQLKRIVTNQVGDALAPLVLDGRIAAGQSARISVGVDGGRLVATPAA